jgi:uncharacterized membrane protein YGL010W
MENGKWKIFFERVERVHVLPEMTMSESLLENYRAKHKHPLNRLCHSVGIPMIVISLPLFFFNWRWAVTLFVLGWILQFVGHAIEGNQPAFFKNPVYLLVGPFWLLRRAATVVGLAKTPTRPATPAK